MPRVSPILAEETATPSILFWLIVLLGVVVAMMGVVYLLRRSLREDDDGPTNGPAFTLGDFREMLRKGQITNEEFAKARDALVAATKKSPAQGPDTGSDNPPGPTIINRPDRPQR